MTIKYLNFPYNNLEFIPGCVAVQSFPIIHAYAPATAFALKDWWARICDWWGWRTSAYDRSLHEGHEYVIDKMVDQAMAMAMEANGLIGIRFGYAEISGLKSTCIMGSGTPVFLQPAQPAA